MTKEEVLKSKGLKKRFCKDCNLPINLFDEPYFMRRLNTLDVLFGCIKKFDVFCADLENFSDEQNYFEYYNSVKDSAITMIKNSQGYYKFINDDFSDARIIRHTIMLGKNNLYIEDNADKFFLSIDMKKANFSALHHYDSEIFKKKATWEDYIGAFTWSEHIKNSKYIRQVILGACNPKKQVTYETYLMTILYLHIKDVLGEKVSFYSLTTDELIIDMQKTSCTIKEIEETISSCQQNIGSLVRCELFKLRKLSHYGWLKEIYKLDDSNNMIKDSVVFKGVNADIYHQLVKHFFGNKITEDDLVFYYNGELARFLKEVKNPWK